MKFVVDEALPVKAIKALRGVLGGNHEFIVVGEGEIPKGTQDVELFQAAANIQADAVITADIKQMEGLDRLHERKMCRDSNLHWVGIPRNIKASGRHIAQIQTAQLVGCFAPLVRLMEEAPLPRAYLLRLGSAVVPCAEGYPQDL